MKVVKVAKINECPYCNSKNIDILNIWEILKVMLFRWTWINHPKMKGEGRFTLCCVDCKKYFFSNHPWTQKDLNIIFLET